MGVSTGTLVNMFCNGAACHVVKRSYPQAIPICNTLLSTGSVLVGRQQSKTSLDDTLKRENRFSFPQAVRWDSTGRRRTGHFLPAAG